MTLQMLRSPLKPYQPSGGLWFDGKTGHVDCGNDSSLKASNYLTILVSVTPRESTHLEQFMVGDAAGILDRNYELYLYQNSDIRFLHGDGAKYEYITGTPILVNIHQWIAVSISNLNIDFYKYINTMKKISKTLGFNVTVPAGSYRIRVGGSAVSYPGTMSMSTIYEAIVIAEALTENEIRGIMEGCRLPTEWDCRLWLDFRQGHTRDLSGNGNHGKIYGGAYLMPPVTPMAHAIGGLAE